MPQAASPVSSAVTSPSDTESRTASPSRTASTSRTQEVNEQYSGPPESNRDQITAIYRQDSHTDDDPELTSLPAILSPPNGTKKHGRDQSRSIFANLKAAKSSNKVHKLEATIRQVPEDTMEDNAKSPAPALYSLQKGSGSTPDLSLSTLNTSSSDIPGGPAGHNRSDNAQRPVGPSVSSDTALVTTSADPSNPKKPKPRFAHLLNRTRSIRIDEGGGRRSKPPTPIQTTTPLGNDLIHEENQNGGLKTAPLEMEHSRSFRHLMSSTNRNKSADRQPSPVHQAASNTRGRSGPQQRSLVPSTSTNFRDGTNSKLFANLKETSSKAADGLGKAGKAGRGFLNKIGRSGSSHSKEEVPEGPYQIHVINMPLVQQTRRTRIAKRMEDSRDKTEFWMPALPWRCIDYLNFRGCEEEGLYRIPGSGPRIKEYQERFDRELDINLFEESDLYDINIIGSLFKAWLRDLPSEILPKVTQARIAAAYPEATEVPQMLRDELSNLPPWNYYLLFAITCHLSLLHAYADKNKMSYSNLCICFQPCIGIDAYCFQFLVCQWRSCWQGCNTEKEYLEQEYRILDGTYSPEEGQPMHGQDVENVIVRVSEASDTIQSSDAAVPSTPVRNQSQAIPGFGVEHSNTEHHDDSAHQSSHNRSQSQLPPLQPMMPLSPLNWDVGHAHGHTQPSDQH
ncbi:MAG: hypothetical protein Q9174_002330 [Haloplaca sp. 1 TL-2023]